MITVSKDRMSAEMVVSADTQVNATELWQALEAAGICHGLRSSAVTSALQTGETTVVAEGTPPVPGEDDRVHWFIDEKFLDEEVRGTIAANLRQIVQIPAVEPGQPLAKKIPGTPGVPGKDVYGEDIPPPSSKEIVLRALQGTELSADGCTVLALISGRPRFERSGAICRFQVLPVYTHSGDVTVATGHLRFQGDIVIWGNLTEGTLVTAAGSVEVAGNCIGAAITAGQSIRVSGNAIQSRLLSGSERQFAAKVLPLFDELILSLSELSSVMDSLDSRGQLGQLPFAQIGSRIVSLRYPQYTETLTTLSDMLKQKQKITPGFPGVEDAINKLAQFWPDSWTKRSQVDDLASLASQTKNAFSGLSETDADILIAYALNSNIQAAGNIMVQGQGSLHSTLKAGEEVQILGKLRSGSVTAKRYIFAREVGSDAGALTTLTVDSGGKIEFDKAFENTILQVGRNVLKVSETAGKCRTGLDGDARLQLVARR
jgi:hypothetical protein